MPNDLYPRHWPQGGILRSTYAAMSSEVEIEDFNRRGGAFVSPPDAVEGQSD